tara:strand:+ start:183 stop:560 length:378 start_codon:yes stop_codon:yes gene_type:complete
MNCPTCNNEMSKGIFISTAEDSRILDNGDNLVFIFKTNEFVLESDSEEIGSYNDVYYCSTDSYFEPNENKKITTEQEFINRTFQIYNSTKTISDIITELNKIYITDSESIKVIKEHFTDVSDWSI